MIVTLDDIAIFVGYAEFTTTTIPTETQVEKIIELVENEINVIAKNKKVNIDYNNTEHKTLVTKYAIFGVCAIILTTFLNNNQSEGSQANYYKERYQNFLDNIEKYFLPKFISIGMD